MAWEQAAEVGGVDVGAVGRGAEGVPPADVARPSPMADVGRGEIRHRPGSHERREGGDEAVGVGRVLDDLGTVRGVKHEAAGLNILPQPVKAGVFGNPRAGVGDGDRIRVDAEGLEAELTRGFDHEVPMVTRVDKASLAHVAGELADAVTGAAQLVWHLLEIAFGCAVVRVGGGRVDRGGRRHGVEVDEAAAQALDRVPFRRDE